MIFKVTLSSVAMILASNAVWADKLPYYNVEEISITADSAFPSAISEDGEFIGLNSMKAALHSNIDIGLPFTFNRRCQYDDIICELAFSGSENPGDLSYENAYKQWRNAQSTISLGYTTDYTRYFMANTRLNGSEQAQIPYALGDDNSSDVQVTDVTDPLPTETDDRFIVGYASAPYQDGQREFVRRAFIKSQSGTVTSLAPTEFDDDNGGFSSAYKLKEVTYGEGTSDPITKTLVIGSASVSYPQGTDEYFKQCFSSAIADDRYTLNELMYCPGFDTQAWAWDVTTLAAGTAASELTGNPLASQWLDNNDVNNGKSLTYSASALDINASGVAVGVSTFAYSDSSLGARQRAIIMTPSATGEYGEPTVIADATADIGSTDDQESGIYNTWAQAITDSNIVLGNREYAAPKGRNIPLEFFIYDIAGDTVQFPLLDKKVLTTEQRIAGRSSAKTGANSLAYDINEAGFVVGEVDDYDQTDPVYQASPRSQTAFLYDNNSKQSWLINDLICSEDDSDVVTSPRYKIRSARVINDDGTVLAEGFKYGSADDYKNKVNATQVAFKLTRNVAVTSPDESPNCWDSTLLKTTAESPYQRSGGASFWLWIFALPLLLVRRFCK